MKKFLICMTCLTVLASCSSSDLGKEEPDNPTTETLSVFDVTTSGCKTSLSEEETIPEVYDEYMEKSPVLSFKLGEDGTAECMLSDILENCAIEGIDVKAIGKDREIVLVYYPMGDPTLLADCICAYDVDFKIKKLTSGIYKLTVFHAGYSADYSKLAPLFEGQIELANNKTEQITLASKSSFDTNKEEPNNPTTETLSVFDIVKSDCKTSLSEEETIPEVYDEYMEKSPVLSFNLGEDGTADCKLSDVLENCAVEGINVKVIGKDKEIVLVYHPMGDPTLLADCICAYDVDFKIEKLTTERYSLIVYRAGYSGDYSKSTPVFKGNIMLEVGKSIDINLSK